MTPGTGFILGLGAGMLLERALIWSERKLESYYRRRRERRELDEFWSER